MGSVYAVTTISSVCLGINVSNTDQIRGPTVRVDHSYTSILNSRQFVNRYDILSAVSLLVCTKPLAIILPLYCILLREWSKGGQIVTLPGKMGNDTNTSETNLILQTKNIVDI